MIIAKKERKIPSNDHHLQEYVFFSISSFEGTCFFSVLAEWYFLLFSIDPVLFFFRHTKIPDLYLGI